MKTKQKNKNKKSNFIHEIKESIQMKMSGILWFAFSALMIWFLLKLMYLFYGFSFFEWFKTIPIAYPFFIHIYSEISRRTAIGILSLFAISSLFIFPVPLEALFFTYIRNTNHFYFYVLSTLGLFIGQIINYSLGRYFGFIFRHFFNNKTKKSIKEKISKYGGGSIVITEIFLLPFQLFNFFMGLFRYDFKKFLFFSLLGLIIKNLILWLIYVNFFLN